MTTFERAWLELLGACASAQLWPESARSQSLEPFSTKAAREAARASDEEIAQARPFRALLLQTWAPMSKPWVIKACAPALRELAQRPGLPAISIDATGLLFELWKQAPDEMSFFLKSPRALRAAFASSQQGKLEGSYALQRMAISAARDPREDVRASFAAHEADFLRAIDEAGLGGAWVHCCASQGSLDFASRACQALDLSALGQDYARSLFRALCVARCQPLERLRLEQLHGGVKASKRERRDAIAQVGQAKAQCWRAARGAGVEPLGGPAIMDEGLEVSLDPHGAIDCPSAAWVLKAEAELGGAARGPAIALWARFSSSPKWLDLESQLWDGASGAAWGFAHGADPQAWEPRRLRWLQGCSRESVDSFLRALADAGRRFSPAEPGFDELFDLGARAGCSPGALDDLARMGARPCLTNAQGAWPLQTVLQEMPHADRARAAEALWQIAQAQGQGPAFLQAKGADGSGPMHWAANARSAGALELLAAQGLGVNALDAKNRAPAHALARALSGAERALAWPAIETLERLGADWGALDAKGLSPLATLVSKGALDEAIKLAKMRPANAQALWAKTANALSAADIAGRVGGPVWARFERGAMDIETKAPAARAKGSRL